MKNLGVLAFLILIAVVASLIQRNYSKNIQREPSISDNKISPTLVPSSTSHPTSILTFTPTTVPTSIPTARPTNTNINNFIYPNSVKISVDASSVILQSSDDPQIITNWYKDKITNMGMTAKSFVQTNTNGNVLNKLVAANSDLKLTVTISRKNNQSSVEIKVSVN